MGAIYQALQELREVWEEEIPNVTLLCFFEDKRFYLSLLGNTIQSANKAAKLYANTQGLMEENEFETVIVFVNYLITENL